MSLWDLLTVLSGASAFGGALAAARAADVGGWILVLAVVLGSGVAISCVAAVRAMGHLIDPPTDVAAGDDGAEISDRALRLLYAVAFGWIFMAGAIGMQVVGLMIDLVS